MTKQEYKQERCQRCSYHADCGFRLRNRECEILDSIDAAFEAGCESAAENRPVTVYICGPISGHDEAWVRERFRHAECAVRNSGRIPVSPLDNGLKWDAPWTEHVKMSLIMMLKCDALLVLPGWEQSKGGKLEVELAQTLGMPVEFFETKNSVNNANN